MVQDDGISKKLQDALNNGMLGFHIIRNHDATPNLVKFGQLQSQAFGNARYPVLQENGQWKCKTYQELCELRGRVLMPTGGVVEIFAQSASIHWSILTEPKENINHRLVIPPMVLARSNASTLHTAFEEALEVLNLNNLAKVAAHVKATSLSNPTDVKNSSASFET